MRNLLLSAALITAALFAGCSNASDSRAADAATDAAIDSTSIRATLIEGAHTYRFDVDGDECYITISARVEWPREIGTTHLANLSDTLLAASFPACKGLTVEHALTQYLDNTKGIVDGPVHRVKASEATSDEMGVWGISTEVARTALTEKYVTYEVTSMSYLGGAHPNTSVTPISYDLASGEVITPSYLFIPGSRAKVIKAVASELASQLGCRPDRLSEGGLFSDTLPAPSGMSIDRYGTIVFQYGQYEIAPYSMGIITVKLSPYQLRDLLTPAARALLLPS